ncbi:hypothetical protein SteCoe_32140 [Stentor coeruleus]|uniref:Uncharacterized protein n=1 Tax=Stentor coeruleus TaxID=5963 RepID=A0A1R2AZQ2_9CILI|nr:hypothetical protein SteCoe_32140 [Stentor coeruleus]
MIAGILRGVLLRFASEYLSNIDVNKLSLWSGHVSLHNVNLNVSAITNSLNLPYLRLEHGKITTLELNLPWTSLSTKKVEIKLTKVEIELALTDNLVNLNKPPTVTKTEESLLSKILANLSIEIEDLFLMVSMSEEANYKARIHLKRIKVNTTNNQWQEDFINPFVAVNGGIAFRIYRRIECSGLSLRVISGKKDDCLSEFITSHKFENDKCGGCPLCFGFKNSSYYTIFKVVEVSFNVFLFTSNEHTTCVGKHDRVELLKAKNVCDTFIQLSSSLEVKLNLASDKTLVRDLATASEKSVSPEVKPIEIQESESWLSWGKEILFSPFYCSQPNNFTRIKDKITSNDNKLTFLAPSLLVKLRVHNFQELKTLKYVFSAENFNIENLSSDSVSSEGTSPSIYDAKSSGNMRNLQITCYAKQNCTIFLINQMQFSKNNNLIDYQCKKITSKTIKKGQKSSTESISLEKIEGSVNLLEDMLLKINTDPIIIDIVQSETDLIVESLMELKSFYFRLINPEENIIDINASDLLRTEKRTDRRKNDEKTIDELKKMVSMLSMQLEQKNNECILLRKSLLEVAGNSGIAGILNLAPEEIISISQNGKIDGIDVNLILTKDTIYVVTKEGRILNKNPTNEMVSLEERGIIGLSIRMSEGRCIKSTLDNRNEFAQAIKGVFTIKSS